MTNAIMHAHAQPMLMCKTVRLPKLYPIWRSQHPHNCFLWVRVCVGTRPDHADQHGSMAHLIELIQGGAMELIILQVAKVTV